MNDSPEKGDDRIDRPNTGADAIEALQQRVTDLEEQMQRRQATVSPKSVTELYQTLLTLSGKLKGVSSRVNELQKQSGDILESLGAKVRRLEESSQGNPCQGVVEDLEKSIFQQRQQFQERLLPILSAMTKLQTKVEQIQRQQESASAAAEKLAQASQTTETETATKIEEARRQMAALEATQEKFRVDLDNLNRQAESQGGWQGIMDRNRRVDQLEADLTQLKSSTVKESVEQLRYRLQSLETLADSQGGWGKLLERTLGYDQVRQSLESLHHEAWADRLEGLKSRVHAMEAMADSRGGWSKVLEFVARVDELSAFVNQLKENQLNDRVGSVEDQLRGMWHLPDFLGGWDEALKAVSRAKENEELLKSLKDRDVLSALNEQVSRLEQVEQKGGENSQHIDDLTRQLADWKAQADALGGWPAVLEAVGKIKEQESQIEQLRDLDLRGQLEQLHHSVQNLRGQEEETRTGLESARRELSELLHLADAHGGWIHAVEAIARAKEDHPFIEELKAIDIAKRVAALPYTIEDLEHRLKQQTERMEGLGGSLENLLHRADSQGGWDQALEATAKIRGSLEFLLKIESIDFDALGDFFNALKRENLVLRMRRMERTLRELEKIYQIQEMLDKFKTEQRLLLE